MRASAGTLAHQRFWRMNGAGNEILVVDLRLSGAQTVEPAVIATLMTDPRLRFDQMMVLHGPKRADTVAYVRIYNGDGSEAGACGNGMRCVSWVLFKETKQEQMLVETKSGLVLCSREGDRHFTIDMGKPGFEWMDIPLASAFPAPVITKLALPEAPDLPKAHMVTMGNPHAVFFLGSPDEFDIAKLGPKLEIHPLFPDRANISFAHIEDRSHLGLQVWERGAGQTRACGSAACASVVAAIIVGLCEPRVHVKLPGGVLKIEWLHREDTVRMTGPVAFDFEGRFDDRLLGVGA